MKQIEIRVFVVDYNKTLGRLCSHTFIAQPEKKVEENESKKAKNEKNPIQVGTNTLWPSTYSQVSSRTEMQE